MKCATPLRLRRYILYLRQYWSFIPVLRKYPILFTPRTSSKGPKEPRYAQLTKRLILIRLGPLFGRFHEVFL